MLLVLLACADPVEEGFSAFSGNPGTTLGGDRPVTAVLPSGYSIDQSWPLVILLHGYGANATLQDLIFGLGPRVDDLGFIFVAPEGTVDSEGEQFWNATEECCNFFGSTVDDVGYISDLIDEARILYPISTVSIVGHSNGAYMAYRLGCEVPERFDRMVAFAGATYKDESECAGTKPISVLSIHGTADDSVAYASDDAHAGAVETIQRWADKAGCVSPAAVVGTQDYLPDVDGEETTVSQWAGCSEATDIEFWSAEGGDHVFFGNATAFKDDVAAFALDR